MWKRFSECFSCTGRTKDRNRTAEEKLSRNGDSERILPTELDEEGEAVHSSNAKHSGGLPQDGDEDISTHNESKESENLRCRGRKEAKSKVIDNDSDDNLNCSSTQTGNKASQKCSDNSRQDIEQSPEISSSEAPFQSGKAKDTFRNEIQTIDNVNKDESADNIQTSSSKQRDTFNNIGDYKGEKITKVPEIVISEAVDEYNEEKEPIIKDGSSINNSYDIENEVTPSSKDVIRYVEAEHIVEHEVVNSLEAVDKDEVSSLVESQASIEPNEEFVLHEEEAIKDAPHIVSTTTVKCSDDTSTSNDFDIVNDNNSDKRTAKEPASREKEVEETLNSAVETSFVVSSNSYANEKGIGSAIANKFSGKLSKSVLDAVRQDTQLLYGRSEDGVLDNGEEKALLKFSNVLADSIVKIVLDFAKIDRGHNAESDKNSDLTTNGAYPPHSINDSEEDLAPCESNSTEEEFVRETVDQATHESLHEYAKKLSEKILNGVHELNGYCSEPVECSLTEIYVTKLTETVLTDAIEGAKCCTLERKSLTDSNIVIKESRLDMFIDKVVENILKDAILKVVVGDEMEQIEDGEEHEGTLNGDHVNSSSQGVGATGETKDNGKFQSKWLSEDDLDELYDDDLSDEGDDIPLDNAEEMPVDNAEHTPVDNAEDISNTSDNLTKKEKAAFWRKSLIQDLDDELEFEDFESPHSSSLSSLPKPTNGECSDDGGSDKEHEIQDHSRATKAPEHLISQTTSSTSGRTRIRSVDSSPVLVFDNGSSCLRVGFSGKDTPKEIVPSVVGTPLRYSQEISGMEYSYRPGLVFGDDAIRKAGVLHIDYPMKSDVIENWNEVEGLWSYVLGSLMGVQENPDFPILITQSALNPKKNTEKMAEIIFEHFHLPSMFIANQPVLSLFSMGYTSGLSFCSGFHSTQAAVVYEGHMLPHTVKQLDIAGFQLTETLGKLLMSREGFGFRSSSQWQIVNGIKEKLAFVSLDFEKDANRYRSQAELQQAYELPDGQIIEIGLERFGCAETLFRPMELGLTQSPVHTIITESINSCEEELQDMCYKSIGISGGTTLMNGFVPRLAQELREYDGKFKNFTVPEHRDLSTWIGGSVMASLPTFREMVVTIDEYADGGARAVHSKCF